MVYRRTENTDRTDIHAAKLKLLRKEVMHGTLTRELNRLRNKWYGPNCFENDHAEFVYWTSRLREIRQRIGEMINEKDRSEAKLKKRGDGM